MERELWGMRCYARWDSIDRVPGLPPHVFRDMASWIILVIACLLSIDDCLVYFTRAVRGVKAEESCHHLMTGCTGEVERD